MKIWVIMENCSGRVSGKTDIAVLPETFTTGFSMDVEKLADTMDGPTIPTIKRWAKKYKLAVVR